jgi:hypothetical protein
LAGSGSHPERQAGLERVARAAGAQDLWTFAMVEDDLFLRDCVGAVPGRREIAAVMDALEANGSVPARGRALSRRILVFPPCSEAGPVLAAAVHVERSEPDARSIELLACLSEVLATAEAAFGSRVGNRPEAVPVSLRRRLDGLAAEIVRDALDRADGDHAAAAARLGVSEDELAHWAVYLDLL